jgi:hypothetical protein
MNGDAASFVLAPNRGVYGFRFSLRETGMTLQGRLPQTKTPAGEAGVFVRSSMALRR